MAELVAVCFRTPSAEPERVERRLAAFLHAICPDHIAPRPPAIVSDGCGLFLGVLNPGGENYLQGASACTGWLMNQPRDWWIPGTEIPEGTFAMVRSSPETVEAIEDYAGSRTLWIACTDDCFIASTSQRAIPWFLRSFEPDPAAMSWMLSSGLLGPDHGWDRRSRPLAPGGRATLDRQSWRLAIEAPEVTLAVDDVPHEVHIARLRSALERTIAAVDLPGKGWPLALSGGFDSRSILILSRDHPGLECLTWDRPGALEISGTEAHVAHAVSRYVGVPLRFMELEMSSEPAVRIIDRFIAAGEGRSDHILGYVDGLKLWKLLFDQGTPGIIRGDHGLGRKGATPVSPEDARHTIGLARWDEYALPSLTTLGLEHLGPQALPAWAGLREGEPIGDFRDRLHHRYRIPFLAAALTTVKTPYCEIAEPLLVKSIHSLQRGLPESLRADKTLFREAMRPLEIPVAYAIKSSASRDAGFFGAPRVSELLRDELNSQETRNLLSVAFADYVLSRMAAGPAAGSTPWSKRGPVRRLKAILPQISREAIRKHRRPRPPRPHMLALRALIIKRMAAIMAADARAADAGAAQYAAQYSAGTGRVIGGKTSRN